ncbi:hypothetical protein OHA63_36060 [Streptomyces anulatus]|uniref:hypothetical protein n=1 Tax=Streptomyces anulatus TaxID=1892 RepID=UPI002E37976B|nr:hypothetical protein [Streptomyces anulatus]
MAVSRMGRQIGGAAAVAVLAAVGLMGDVVAQTAAPGSTVTVAEGDLVEAGQSSMATCPVGTHVIGGGYRTWPKYTDGGAYADNMDINAPGDTRHWLTMSHNGRSKAYALCDSTSAPTNRWSGDGGLGGEMSYAKCPDGTTLVNGGYHFWPAYGNDGTPQDSVDMNAPAPDRPNTWVAKGHSKDGSIRAVALCRQNS